ncbi:MAG: restriction endonuclease subunit S [Christensenellaceae bacterium]|nr:restriction endonuclease subunit S [Christensenellaceae bacterium]
MKFKDDEWKKVKIEDLGEVIGGGTPSTKVDEYYGGNIPWITPKDLSGYTKKYIFAGERNITDKGLKNSSAKLLPKGTVLFSSRAPIGYIAIAGQKVSTNQGFKSVIPDEEVTSSEFLYYLLKYNTEKIKNKSSGSTFSEISGKSMKNVEVVIPNKKTQSKISNILSSFDQKIEVNNKIIANLEEQAQAIFKSWFIDFEPFQDGEFVESELGLIPEGWGVKKVNDICNLKIGRTPPRKEEKWFSDRSGVKWISIKDMGNSNMFIDKSTEYLTEEAVDKFNVPVADAGVLLLSFKLTVGRLAITSEPMCTNEAIAQFSDSKLDSLYLYLYFKEFPFSKLGNTSSIGNAVNSKIIKDIDVLVPEKTVQERFADFISPIANLINNLNKENNTLSQTRNTLLPKLMSGEIDVSDIKLCVEEESHV